MKKPRPPSRIGRKRRTLGWTLLTLGVLVAGVWVFSVQRTLHASFKDWDAGIAEGCLHLNVGPRYRDLGWYWGPRVNPVEWLPGRPSMFEDTVNIGFCSYAQTSSLGRRYVVGHIALWPIPLLLWTPAALLLRSSGILARRRAMTGQCSKCGYSLAGLGDGAACPECGKGTMQKTVS